MIPPFTISFRDGDRDCDGKLIKAYDLLILVKPLLATYPITGAYRIVANMRDSDLADDWIKLIFNIYKN